MKVPPCSSLQLELVVLRALAEVGDRLLDLGEAQAIGVADHRHRQALAAADRDADVVVVLVDDVGAADLARSPAGTSFSASIAAFTKKDMKPSLMPYFSTKLSWYSLRSAMTPRHVDLVEGREQRGGLLRLDQALRDASGGTGSSAPTSSLRRRRRARARRRVGAEPGAVAAGA